jgi:vancomycin resistance protein VanJ
MLRIECRCGEVYQADPQHVGRRIRCRCGRTLRVRPPRRNVLADARVELARRLSLLSGTLRRPRVRHRPRPTGPATLWTRRAALACLALATAAALLLWGLADRWWPATALLFGPRWLLLLPPAAVAIAALVWHRLSLLPCALAAALVVGPVMGFRLGIGRAEEQGEVVRIASFNAMGSVDAVARVLVLMHDHEVDVAGIQECTRPPAVFLRLGDWHVHHDGHMCLISRYPIVSAVPARWDELEAARDAGIGGSGDLVRYRIRTPQRDVDIVNLHLETARRGLQQLRYGLESRFVGGNIMIRRIGSRRAFETLGDGRDSLIVLGDFNMPIESAIYRDHWSVFDNAFSRTGRGFGLTKDNGWIRVRIDHVLSGNAWRAQRAWVGPDIGSDHRPVFAELRWSGSPAP